MGRRSSITKLPPEVVADIDRKLAERRCSVLDVLDELRKAGITLSKSALYRHSKSIDEIAASLRDKRTLAEAVARSLTDTPERDVSNLVIEKAQGMLFDLALDMSEEEGVELADRVKHLKDIALASNSLSMSKKHQVDTALKVRRATKEEDAEIATTVLRKNPGISEQTVEDVRAHILGIEPIKVGS